MGLLTDTDELEQFIKEFENYRENLYNYRKILVDAAEACCSVMMNDVLSCQYTKELLLYIKELDKIIQYTGESIMQLQKRLKNIVILGDDVNKRR